MAELLSVGLDIGTTSTQMIVSSLQVRNQAGAFSVPEMQIESRKILYRSAVHFTPLLEGNLINGDKIRHLVEEEYKNAGITRPQVDTGAIIITGETSRKENAQTVVSALSALCGDFVVATAGPALESVLAAKGAGAVDFSRETGQRVLHMDIGGGTTNISLIEKGKIICTDCLNVGGRLVKTQNGQITYVSPVLQDLWDPSDGLDKLTELLVSALEMAAGLREPTDLLSALRSRELGEHPGCTATDAVISFSGGVADCIHTCYPPDAFGDIGPSLGQTIRKSRLCRGKYRLGRETIRATVIGAGCHSAQLSGSTIFRQNISLPRKNCPVVTFRPEELTENTIRRKLSGQDAVPVIALTGEGICDYAGIKALAVVLTRGAGTPILLSVEQDMAKALGQAIALERPGSEILCIDRVRLQDGDFLDIGTPVGPALPVVVKTLAFLPSGHTV